MKRGERVTVVAFRGNRLDRRVWEDVGAGVLVCSDDEYQKALQLGIEPQSSGFPKQDVSLVDSLTAERGSSDSPHSHR